MMKIKALSNLSAPAICTGDTSMVDSEKSEHENRENEWHNSQLYHQTRNQAILQERDRLSRELHDSIAQALGYLNLQISNTSRLLATGQIAEARENLERLKQLADETYIDLREEIFNLRANTYSEAEFLNILNDYLAKYRTYYGLKVEVVFDQPFVPEFAVDVSSQVLRIIQEALINVRRHARVNEAKIRFKKEDDQIRITIEDSGQGFDFRETSQNGFSYGLQIMQERVATIGGRLEIISSPAEGTRLMLWVPVQPKN